MNKHNRQLLMVVTFAVFVLTSGLLIWWLQRPQFVPPQLPSPNGYDELLAAAEKTHKRTGSYDEMASEELGEVTSYNQPALELARSALANKCVVAIDWTGDRAWFDDIHFARLQPLREIARAFAAEGHFQSRQGNGEQALRSGQDNLRVGTAIANGGFVIDWELGHASTLYGLLTVRAALDDLPEDQVSNLLSELQQTHLDFEDPNQVLRRELAFFRQAYGPVQWLIMKRTAIAQQQTMRLRMAETTKRYEALLELLKVHAALRSYQLDNESLPATLEELTPDYISKVPTDLFSGRAFAYRVTEEGYLLYSVGPNGVDDGGVETTDGIDGDLLLEPASP